MDVENALRTLDEAVVKTIASLPDGEPPPEAVALKDLGFRVRKLRSAWGRPQSLGFFGPSQAGKSFLVGALLGHELGTLKVRTRTGEADFLREINPAKGVESTGVVTRFSTQKGPSLTRGDFTCRVLSLEVMLESLATGFLVECTAPAVDAERVERVLRDARMQAGPPAPARYRDAWDTVWHDLLKKYQDRHPYLNELRRHPELRNETWKKGISSIAGWTHVFSLLWGGRGYARDLDVLADKLIAGLEQLGHPEAIEADLTHVRASADKPSLIDAACLNAIGTPQAPIGVYVPEAARDVAIEPAVMAALVSEIRLSLAPVAGSLLGTADLLDFPGGRALRGINGFEPGELNTGNLENAIEVYKRGKLTFLFEQFSLDREITALVICSPGPTKPEAIQMQHQIERWLQIRHGTPTPTDAEEIHRPSLFLALTKYDMSLGALRSDNARDRWDSRVEEACIAFWARSHSSWVYNWGGPERPFTNCFWIRNPYSDQMQTLRAGTPDYEEVKRGYHESRAVRTYVADYAGKWTAMEGTSEDGLPKSGVPLLASHLRSKLAEDVKAKELLAEARAIHTQLVDALRLMTPSRDEEELRERLEQNAKSLVEAIKREMHKRYSGAVFGEMVELVTLPLEELEPDVRTFWAQLAPMSIKTSDKVKKLMVQVLKHWAQRSLSRLRSSDLEVPLALVERYVREVCTSKMLLPVLGAAVFPYFNRSTIDFELVTTIFQVKISDQLLSLFMERPRRTPAIPVRLSFSEVTGAEAEETGEIDWTDVSFEEDEAAASASERVELVFAGNRYFEHWAAQLPSFYVRNHGELKQGANEDPRVRELIATLRTVEALTL
ncbi:MAG: putative virulence factor [Sandaracinaceae bacterium]|nr:putative virulence factor [Sandaracinaceae bacterium]